MDVEQYADREYYYQSIKNVVAGTCHADCMQQPSAWLDLANGARYKSKNGLALCMIEQKTKHKSRSLITSAMQRQ